MISYKIFNFTLAGAFGRSAAKISMIGKIDNNLYTPEEVKILSGVDNELKSKSLVSPASVA